MVSKFNMVSRLLMEAFSPVEVQFVIHEHTPRNTNLHFDLRFEDPKNKGKLFSFALPSDFPKTMDKKTLCFLTHSHLERWLHLKSYRLVVYDKGTVVIKIMTNKFFSLEFKGKLLTGNYKLFKIRTKREDSWLLARQKNG